MPSIDDHANGTEQTRAHPNSAAERRRAVRLVCSYAHHADDARALCTTLGLDPRDGRRQETGTVQSRVRDLPSRIVVYLLLAGSLFAQLGYVG